MSMKLIGIKLNKYCPNTIKEEKLLNGLNNIMKQNVKIFKLDHVVYNTDCGH